jgi:biopolymer transport protein ExbB/TolQ
MITFLAASINYIILAFAISAFLLALYLWRRSRELPEALRATILETAREWGLSDLAERGDVHRVLEGLRLFVEQADEGRRGELRGFLSGNDRKRDLELPRVRTAQRLAHIVTEVFPLLGILGTVCALSVSMSVTSSADAVSSELLNSVLSLFGTAIDSTIYGLICAVTFMIAFGAIDGRIEQAAEMIAKYRDIIDKAVLLAWGTRS